MAHTRRPLIWCVDSPGFGGSEIDLMRVMEMVGTTDARVVSGPSLCPELRRFFEERRIPVHARRALSPARHAPRGMLEALSLIARFPGAAYAVWAHHSDSSRWLQAAFAISGADFIVAERLIPGSAQDMARSRLSIPLKRLSASRARCMVVNGDSQADHYREVFGLANARVEVIRTTRPTGEIAARVSQLRRSGILALRSELGLPEGPLLVVVGRLATQKGQADLIRAGGLLAAEGHPTPHLVLVGEGPDREELERLGATEIPGRLRLVGHQTDPIRFLAAADAFVLPSLAEGLPGALVEAMAAGLPCIATDIPGNRELVRDGETGLLVPSQNPAALARALRELLGDPALAARVAKAGQALVFREYDEASERNAWQGLFAKLRQAEGRPIAGATH